MSRAIEKCRMIPRMECTNASGGCFTANACLFECRSNASTRYQVVKSSFWWKIKIGDGESLYGRFYTKTEAERMAMLLLREFRNGMYIAQVGIKEYNK